MSITFALNTVPCSVQVRAQGAANEEVGAEHVGWVEMGTVVGDRMDRTEEG